MGLFSVVGVLLPSNRHTEWLSHIPPWRGVLFVLFTSCAMQITRKRENIDQGVSNHAARYAT